MFSTIPCCTPLLLARPKPRISSLPNSFLRPAMAAIFVVPMSRPTIMGCSLFIVVCVFVVKPHPCSLSEREGDQALKIFLSFVFYNSSFKTSSGLPLQKRGRPGILFIFYHLFFTIHH